MNSGEHDRPEVGPDSEDMHVLPHVLAEYAEHKAVRRNAHWWAASILFHVAVTAAVICLTPVREWIFGRGEREDLIQAASEAKVARIVNEMVAAYTSRMLERVHNLREAYSELDHIRELRYARYAQVLMEETKKQPEPFSLLLPEPPKVGVPSAKMGSQELYAFALNVEEEVYTAYRHIRATELGRIQLVSLSSALVATRVMRPEHPSIDWAALDYAITRARDPRLKKLKYELGKARAELETMVADARRMLDVALGFVRADAEGATVGWVLFEGAGLGMGESTDLGRLDDPFDGFTAPDPDAHKHIWGEGVGPVVHRNQVFPIKPSANLGDRPPSAGRRMVTRGALGNTWMHIDTWYIIGPFGNPDRKYLHHAFPPEACLRTGVDLDATYVGKGNRRVRWIFRKSDYIPVIPHAPQDSAIWYAYTEVYSEKEQTRWCIFGSDDFGKTWVNGDLVFISPETPHPWIPDRGFKEVRFKQGYNPILFKLENAWGDTGFSMCIFTGED